jgi:multidrug efflux pump subunit AcrB
LRGSFQGLLSDQIQVGEEAYDVEVRFAEADRNNMNDLEVYRVTLPDGETVPLGEVAELKWRKGWSRLAHTDGQRVVTVFGNVDGRVSNALAAIGALEKDRMEDLRDRYPGLQMQIRGASENGAETGASMRNAAMIGCLGVFVILSFQFRSYVEPLIVMAAIPFAFVGVIWGHWLWDISLSLPSIMGYASLAGIVVNDSILLVLFLKSCRDEGAPLIDAAISASRLRFRAVMITSLTTIAGLLPLLAEQSLQAQVLIPIAISICFGLMTSTVLVLLVIPPLYVLLSDFGLTTGGKMPPIRP